MKNVKVEFKPEIMLMGQHDPFLHLRTVKSPNIFPKLTFYVTRNGSYMEIFQFFIFFLNQQTQAVTCSR